MAIHEDSLSQFKTGIPPADQPFQLLCEDQWGMYKLAFACRWVDGAWLGPRNDPIAVTVIGWRKRRD